MSEVATDEEARQAREFLSGNGCTPELLACEFARVREKAREAALREPFWAHMTPEDLALFAKVFEFYENYGPIDGDEDEEDEDGETEGLMDEASSWAGRFAIEAERVKK